MAPNPDHSDNSVALRRIEGQVRGVQRMVEEKKYCVDILTQISAIKGALARVEENILRKHLQHCVTDAVKGGTETERQEKLEEIVNLLHLFRK
ncbi:MAG: metal-sensitive transcriptional regulator [Planctomycetota bacterium]|jgi:DNA-binding FrmR family transcriptional regulator